MSRSGLSFGSNDFTENSKSNNILPELDGGSLSHVCREVDAQRKLQQKRRCCSVLGNRCNFFLLVGEWGQFMLATVQEIPLKAKVAHGWCINKQNTRYSGIAFLW